MNLGEVIRRLRLERNLSQAELGERIGKTHYLISAIERGVVSPSLETLVDIAKALGKPLYEIFFEIEKGSIDDPSLAFVVDQMGKMSKEDLTILKRIILVYTSTLDKWGRSRRQ